MAISIESDSIIPADTSFKISAGPGAGKTHWLSLHIKNVISNSKRLGASRKIACISYTNVGADTIMKRLTNEQPFVEACTIHSFLYTNVVKPFLRLEASSYGIDPYNIRIVPNEPFLTRGFEQKVLESCGIKWISPECLLYALKQKCNWKYADGSYIGYKPTFPVNAYNVNGSKTKYKVPQRAYDEFVKLRWRYGFISYDDVIYFAIELLRKHPKIYKILAAKYPYFFVDEFQDSTPAIVDFIKEMGKNNITVGVVGDKAQSIYYFIGATVEMFDGFKLENMVEYEIHGNRRSSPEIIDLLNHIRIDFSQHPIKTSHGKMPILLIGDKLKAYQVASGICKSADLHSLAFKNIVSNSLKYNRNSDLEDDKIIDSDFDSNLLRSIYIKCLIKATEYAFSNDLREAWHYMDLIDDNRNTTISYLRILLDNRKKFIKYSLFDFFEFIKQNVISLPALKKGSNKDFYESHSYLELALSIAVSDSTAIHKTIHKSKGEEFDNVMMVINTNDDVDFLTSPDLYRKPSHRVYYVGMSRAKKNLFINIEFISESDRNKLQGVPIQLIDL